MFSVDNNEMKLTRGDTIKFKVDIFYENGSPYIVRDGDTVTFSVKRNLKDSDYALQKVVNAGELISIEPEETSNLSGRYLYDVQLNTSLGEVFTIVSPSQLYVLEDVTR